MKDCTAILVGCGTMGKRHRSRFEENGVRFTALLDMEAADVLVRGQWERPDFAVVASPASTHFQYAKFFLERKIPVLVEKPLATSAAEAKALVDLALRNGTLLFVAQSECYNPIFLNFRKHLLMDLKKAVFSKGTDSSTEGAVPAPLNVKLEFRREHGYSPRCRDVDVALDLLVHDVSLFLNLFDARDVVVVDDGRGGNNRGSGSSCNGGNHEEFSGCEDPMGDRIRMTLKVVSGTFAGVVANFIADRNSDRDVRSISVDFGRNGDLAGFDYSVSLVRYTPSGDVSHIPDSLDNEHRFFLKLLAGACGDWARRAVMNAANAVALAAGGNPET